MRNIKIINEVVIAMLLGMSIIIKLENLEKNIQNHIVIYQIKTWIL